GFRVVLAPSFGDIFRTNAVKCGLLPVALPAEELVRVKSAVAGRNELTVDLEAQAITHPDGLRVEFELDPFQRETLLHGLDDVARTLKRDAEIAAFEARETARFDVRALPV